MYIKEGVMKSKKIFYLILLAIAVILIIIMGYKKLSAKENFELKQIAEGFTAPVALIPANDDTGRLFVVDQIGIIRIIDGNGQLIDEPFLDLRSRMAVISGKYDEKGLLGMAFHPDFKSNGRFFVYYSASLRNGAPEGWDHTSHISEFKISDSNADKADGDSEKIILQVDEPQMNHNGGDILFGPDNYLYISLGDGGNADDVGLGHNASTGNGQDKFTLLGKILRIDIDRGNPYSIPDDNPFNGKNGLKEIYAYGFRNPYRMSFDSETGELFVADVGQNLWEEIDIVTKGGNYGWNIKEGTHCFSTENPNESPEECPDAGYDNEPLIDPILDYSHSNSSKGISGTAVIGGFVYRGEKIPEFSNNYIFGDWSSNFLLGKGKLLMAKKTGDKWETGKLMDIRGFLLALGEDKNHELYALVSDSAGPSGNGKIFRIVPKEK